MTILLIKKSIDSEEYPYKFEIMYRNEVVENKQIQNKLAEIHKKEKMLKCSCNGGSELYMHVAKINNRYIIKRNDKSQKHDQLCPFYEDKDKFLVFDEGKVFYKKSIFDTSSDTTIRACFYDFCNNIILNTVNNAFLHINKDKSFESLTIPTKDEVLENIKYQLKKKIVGTSKNNSISIFDYAKENNCYLDYGVIDNPFNKSVEKNKMTITKEVTSMSGFKETNKLRTFDVNEYYNALDYLKKSNFSTSAKKYFYITLLHYGKGIKFFIFPIFYLNVHFVFFKNSYEENFLLSNLKPSSRVMKIFSNQQHKYIKNLQFSKNSKKKPLIIEKPNFIVFDKEKTILVFLLNKEDDINTLINSYKLSLLDNEDIEINVLNKETLKLIAKSSCYSLLEKLLYNKTEKDIIYNYEKIKNTLVKINNEKIILSDISNKQIFLSYTRNKTNKKLLSILETIIRHRLGIINEKE